MSLGDLTKDLTKQLTQQVLAPPPKEAPKPPAPPDPLGSQMFGQIAAMQRAVKEDEELAVWFSSGAERIRVVEIFLPTPNLAILTGFDPERNLSRVITPVEALQLVAKTVKVQAGNKPVSVRLVLPKPSTTP